MRVAVLAGALACVLTGAATTERVDREIFLMGTRATLVTWATDHHSGITRLEKAVRVLEDAEAELSTWRHDSQVSRLNRHAAGRPFPLSAALCDTFGVLFEWHAATAGAFDPAIGRLTDAWGIHAEGRVPPAPILQDARTASGLALFTLDRARCEITRRADATIDVGAFGKGDALDRVERSIDDAPWLIDLGGQISVHGIPPRSRGWYVAIAHPQFRERAVLEVELTAGSLSTSGGSERDLVVDGRRIAHHLDPRTGQPVMFDGSVTVWHRRGLVADILSTSLFVMGVDEGLRWAERRGIAACFLEPREDGTVVQRMTSAFKRLTAS